MGFLGNIFGAQGGNSGGAGLNYNADSANIIQPVTSDQLGTAYTQSQQGLGMQQGFYNQLAGQSGIQNQSNVFNQQQGLANMLGAQAMGYGPNPALAQLNQTTGQNIASQNALMAGQRGASSNVGLIARQAAQQGANIQQNAIGQAATMRAQQQLAAQQALQSQQANMANLSTQQIGQQAGALNNYNQATQSEQQALLGAMGNYNNANVGMQSNINTANAGVSTQAAKAQENLFLPFQAHGGLVGKYAEGGIAPQPMPEFQAPGSYAMAYLKNPGQSIGIQESGSPMGALPNSSNGQKAMQEGKSAYNLFNSSGAADSAGSVGDVASSGSGAIGNEIGASLPMMSFDDGGEVDSETTEPNVDSSPIPQPGGNGGSKLLSLAPLLMALAASKGGVINNNAINGEALAASGRMVPGQASVAGDSLKNDKVPAVLSPKEIVIPRSITLSKNAPEKAKQFVAAILARNGMRK